MRQTNFIYLAILFTLLTACCTPSRARAAPLSKKVIKATEEEFNQVARAIRPEHPLVPTNFIENNGELYYYVIPRRLQRLCHDGHRFTIKKIRYKNDYVGIEFESGSGAKPRIRIYTEKEKTQDYYDTVIPAVLRDLFDFRKPWSAFGVVGNSQSKEAHLAGSNHLPPSDSRIGFSTLAEAGIAGYVPCTVCFEVAHWIPLEGYISIRKGAIEAARLRKVAFPPVSDEDLQNEIQDLGEKIVSRFPLPTMGYDYEFKVLHSEIPWAQSYPTGIVFVSDRLLEMIEDPLELEFVLAHEIGHVELYIKEISKDPLADPDPTMDASSIREFFMLRRAHEHEIDLTSLIYLAGVYKDPRVLHAAKTVLRKLQYYGETVPERESGTYDFHPTLLERITFLENNFFIPWNNFPGFCDLDDDEIILTAEVLGVVHNDDARRLVIRVSSTDLMNKEGVIRRSGKCFGKNGTEFRLKKTDYPKVVGRNQSRIFWYDVITNRFTDPEAILEGLENISVLDLGNIGGASDWEPCEGLSP